MVKAQNKRSSVEEDSYSISQLERSVMSIGSKSFGNMNFLQVKIQALAWYYNPVSENPRFLCCRFFDAIWRKKVAFENFSTF